MRKHIPYMLAVVFVFLASRAFAERPDSGTFFSEALGTEKTYRLYLPPGYEADAEKRYPVVYLLHGYNFVRNIPEKRAESEEEGHWPEQEQLPEVADCLFTAGDYDVLLECLEGNGVELPGGVVEAMKAEHPDCPLPLPEMIVVMPDGDSSFYIDRLDGLPQWPPLDGPEYVVGIYRGATGQYETYIARDLVRHVDETYRTAADRGRRGIGGFSMGGIGAMNLLLGHPDVFVSVTSLSAMYNLYDMVKDSFFLSYMKGAAPEIATVFCEDPSRGADCKINKKYVRRNDPYSRLKRLKRTDVHIYFDAGAADAFSGRNNFESFNLMDALLAEKGMTSAPEEHIIPATELNAKGIHSGAYWRSRVGVILTFHAKAFGTIE